MKRKASARRTAFPLQTALGYTTPPPTAAKPPKVASQSKDIREDRGTRQMKTSHNPQTLPHGQ
jgi:hypothetical protein